MFVLLAALCFAPTSNDPVGEVRTLLTTQQTAWNAGKLDEFVNYYDDEAQFFSGGTITKGKAAVLARYRKRYQAEGKEMGKLAFSDIELEAVTPTVVLARGRWAVTMKSGKPSGLFTLIVRKTDVGWRIVHDHTSAAD